MAALPVIAGFVHVPDQSGGGSITADTGYPVPSAGDKTTVIPDYSTPAFSGMDTISLSDVGALSNQVQSLTKIVQAMLTSFQGDKYPHS